MGHGRRKRGPKPAIPKRFSQADERKAAAPLATLLLTEAYNGELARTRGQALQLLGATFLAKRLSANPTFYEHLAPRASGPCRERRPSRVPLCAARTLKPPSLQPRHAIAVLGAFKSSLLR